MQLGIQAMGGGTAQQIHLVRAGGGNEQIGFPDTGIQQNGHSGTVAVNRIGIDLFDADVQYLIAGVDDGQIVPLKGKLTSQGRPNLTGTRDDNLHNDAPRHIFICVMLPQRQRASCR